MIQSFIFSIAGLLFFWGCVVFGWVLFSCRNESAGRANFLHAFLALFLVLSVYSITATGFKTINVLTAVGLILIGWRRKHSWEPISDWFKSLIPSFYIFPFVFIVYGALTLPLSIENDVRFYAKISSALSEFGHENIYHFYNAFDDKFHGMMPYHFPELWLSSIFAKILGLKSIIALKYVTYPFLISLVCYGVLGFVRTDRFLVFMVFIALSMIPFYKLNFS